MPPTDPPPMKIRAYVPAVGPRLRPLLFVVLVLFALLAVDGAYLATITLIEWLTGQTIQNYVYIYAFLAHLVLGMLLIVPLIVFGLAHIKNAHSRPNRMAVRVGYALFGAGLAVVISGLLLMRLDGFVEIKSPDVRRVIYWAHVASPLAVVWLFVLHRLAGPKIQWRVGGIIGGLGLALALAMAALHSQDPKNWNVRGPASAEEYFFPSLARTGTGKFIPADVLMNDEYCVQCHAEIHKGWSKSMHRFSSFTNPAYLFAVRETREMSLKRDGNVQAARFCAGCHDPVPFFSGAFDNADFDDQADPTAGAGITCTVCHAITHVEVRGNSDFTIEAPSHYPFAFSDSEVLRWVNRQLIKAKPAFHKKTFLKPLHSEPQFCGSCHKVHLPKELNHYKWLRGQNHYDSYHLSGVSGHGAQSFYYPPKAEDDCNGCHMPLVEADDFAAGFFDDSGQLKVHDHLFPSANTAIPKLLGMPQDVIERHRGFLEGTLRLDVFGVRKGGTIDGELIAPIGPELPILEPGEDYLIEVVVRTLKLGHHFTQGTSDSNQIWVDATVQNGGKVLGRSGARDSDGFVDPWSHFVNSYVLDRDGNRIDRRNAHDIFVPLYNHQIPPGAADVVHYRFHVPEDAKGAIEFRAALQYRKFDTTYMRYVYGPDWTNDLPIVSIASASVRFPVAGETERNTQEVTIPLWQRWNDYGIGLLRKGQKGSRKGELRQAEVAFKKVEELGRADGALNLARVYLKEGRLEDAVAALNRASNHEQPAVPWTIAWFTGLVNRQNGHLDAAIESFSQLAENKFNEARERGFDFSEDYRVLNELALTLFERGNRERGAAGAARRKELYKAAETWFNRALELDPENVATHYGLSQLYSRSGEKEKADLHRNLHAKYKPDDTARGQAVAKHRAKNPAANHAAESIVIYDLQRDGAFGLDE